MMSLIYMVLMRPNDLLTRDFAYQADRKLTRVSMAGSFNDWSMDANPMKLSEDGKTWSVRLALKPGRYSYKFVLDGLTWITDPHADRNAVDEHGNTNSEFTMAPADYAAPARTGDAHITVSALKHETETPFLNYDRGNLIFRLRVRPNDIASIKLSIAGRKSIQMTDTGGDAFFETYSAQIPWNRKGDIRYRFILEDGEKPMVYGPKGLTSATVSNDFTVKAATFQPFSVPDWVERTIIYQIFPDRFENGDKRNDPVNVAAWESKPTFRSYFGGDVAGIERHLDYLKSLGVSAVYFNPVLKSPIYHRYETSDYFQVDPIFGTNTEFEKLTEDLGKSGIRTILDGVFNHTSTQFFAFADVVKNGSDSKYTHWYTFKSFPVKVGRNPNYFAYYNFESMPKLNYSNPETTQYMLSIPEFWQKHASIAGWRLDAANEVSPDFWRGFRKKVKEIDPNAWILGEVWGDGSDWLKGDQWDSIMNYGFRSAVLGFVNPTVSGKPSDLSRQLMSLYSMYAPQVSRNMMNLLGCHDTPRILTVCNNDASLAKLAATLQFTWVGTPSVYYGDELGMTGDRDPDCRRGMNWTAANPNNDFLLHYKKLIAIRNGNRPLQSGDPLPLVANDSKGVFGFARVLGDQADLVAVNRSNQTEEIDLPLSKVAGLPKSTVTFEFIDSLSGKTYVPTEGTIHLRLAPRGAAVLVPRSGSIRHSRHAQGNHLSEPLATSKVLVSKELS